MKFTSFGNAYFTSNRTLLCLKVCCPDFDTAALDMTFLKDKSGVGIIVDKMKDYVVVIGV